MATDPRKTQQPPRQQQQQAQQQKPPSEVEQIRALVQKTMPRHIKQVLPNVDTERFTRVFLTAIESGPADLMKCTLGSLSRAMLHAAECDLEPGGAYPFAYLIPYKNNERGGIIECQFQISVWGYIELVRRSGAVKKVWADVVYSNDHVETVSGTGGKEIIHRPNWFAARKDRGHVIGSYACALLENGETVFEPVSWEELLAARAANRGRSPAWDTWPEQQYQKVALKRLQKYLPKGKRPDRALELDEDPGTSPIIDVQGESVPEPEDTTPPQPPQAQGPLDRAVAAAQSIRDADGPVNREALWQALCDCDERYLQHRKRVEEWSEPEAIVALTWVRIITSGDGPAMDQPPPMPEHVRLPKTAAEVIT